MYRIAKRVAARYKVSKITHPPVKMVRYLEQFPKKFDAKIKDILSLRDPILGSGSDMDYDAFTDLDIRNPDYDQLKWLFDFLQKERLGDLAKSSLDMLQFDQVWESVQYMDKGLGFLLEDLNRGPIPHVLESLRKEQSSWSLPSWLARETDKTYVKKLVGLFNSLPQLRTKLEDLISFVESYKEKIAAAIAHGRRPEFEMPPTEKKEKLYHASVVAKTIYQKGSFDPKVPEEKGLGGSQSDRSGKASISFTSNFYDAKEIMRTLKEAVMIANGQVKLRHIWDWAKREGILKNVSQYVSSNYNDFSETPANVMELYRIYLTFSKRYNPVFFGNMGTLMKKLKGLSTKNVGILVCTVDMENPDIMYLKSMYEFRVPPEAVLSIDKFIT